MFIISFRKTSFLGSIFLLALFLNYAVLAQSSFPEFALSNDNKDDEISNEQNIGASINIKRPLTRDILLMQEQNNILEALIKRQSEIKKIADNYEDIGLPFNQPLPELSVCKKLPVNVLCLHAYPDLKKHSDVIEQATVRLQETQNQAMEEALKAVTAEIQQVQKVSAPRLNQDLIDNLMSDASGNNDIQKNSMVPNTPIEQTDDFLWSDIKCIQSNCSALIVSSSDSEFRLRAKVGEKITDNIIITAITPTTVKANIDGEIQSIYPMALDGKTQPVKRKKQMASFKTDDQNQNQSKEAPSDNTLLGPTGLF